MKRFLENIIDRLKGNPDQYKEKILYRAIRVGDVFIQTEKDFLWQTMKERGFVETTKFFYRGFIRISIDGQLIWHSISNKKTKMYGPIDQWIAYFDRI